MSSLGDQISRYLNDFRDDVVADLNKIAYEVAEETVETLQSLAPVKTGQYQKSFKIKKEKKKARVYSAEYQLSHLLEKGHATRNGGRTRALKHWEPAEKKAQVSFEKKVRERIERGY